MFSPLQTLVQRIVTAHRYPSSFCPDKLEAKGANRPGKPARRELTGSSVSSVHLACNLIVLKCARMPSCASETRHFRAFRRFAHTYAVFRHFRQESTR